MCFRRVRPIQATYEYVQDAVEINTTAVAEKAISRAWRLAPLGDLPLTRPAGHNPDT